MFYASPGIPGRRPQKEHVNKKIPFLMPSKAAESALLSLTTCHLLDKKHLRRTRSRKKDCLFLMCHSSGIWNRAQLSQLRSTKMLQQEKRFS
ncbi:hypothetical protein CDAR_263581 [Caerostris darwini]|uniref:Uncharacterized protein n=1 Tax=Caerostris darwini TaxID=1538125 RepID=A0AAV4RZG5_9ARAC|nr:hypothetical protein CDAR_263581 [Caerostris darwini]